MPDALSQLTDFSSSVLDEKQVGRRDQWLEAQGYGVLRVRTNNVYGNIAGMVDTIWAALQEMPLVRKKRHPHQEHPRT